MFTKTLLTYDKSSLFRSNPDIFIVISVLSALVLVTTILSEGFGLGLISTSFIKILGKTLWLCMVAIAMDLVWGYCGILSLGHFAFFGLGGYMVGMWLMYERTRDIVVASLANNALPSTPEEITDAIGTQIFGVVGGSELPIIWYFADSLWIQLALVIIIPGSLALVFGWLAFRSRVTGVYLSLTQAMTLASRFTYFKTILDFEEITDFQVYKISRASRTFHNLLSRFGFSGLLHSFWRQLTCWESG